MPLSADFHESVATQMLRQVKDGIGHVEDVVRDSRAPISDITLHITQFDDFILTSRRGLQGVSTCIRTMEGLVKLCKYLGRFIPEVGKILSEATKQLKNTGILRTGRKMLDKVTKMLDKVFFFFLLFLLHVPLLYLAV
jgi:hypothetical protein